MARHKCRYVRIGDKQESRLPVNQTTRPMESCRVVAAIGWRFDSKSLMLAVVKIMWLILLA